jgi:steroid 5-alpha reductase family enzyme
MTGTLVLVVIGIQALLLSAVMAVAWVAQQRTGNSGWVDTVWTFGLGTIGVASALLPLDGSSGARQLLVAALLAIWSLRLGLHIARRSAGITDDPRYAELARDWGADAPREMFWLLQKQALVTIPLAASIAVAAHNPSPIGIKDWLGAALLLSAIAAARVADRQLIACRRAAGRHGGVCDAGLWAWSRHPNYFFEWLGWLAYPLIAVDLTGSYPWGWLALAGPACMYWLLAHVSGVPPLEAHMVRKHGDDYRAYQARTSRFFLWPPSTPPRGQRR